MLTIHLSIQFEQNKRDFYDNKYLHFNNAKCFNFMHSKFPQKKYTLDEKDLFWFILNNKCYLKLKILNENSFFFKVT